MLRERIVKDYKGMGKEVDVLYFPGFLARILCFKIKIR